MATVTGTLFVLAFFTALLLALFRHPLYGLYTYVAVFYLDPPSRWWGASLPDLRWSALAAGITLLAIWTRGPVQKNRISWLAITPARIMILFTVWFWISTLWALDEQQHVPEAILISKYLLVFYMIYRLVDTPAKITSFLLAHITGCLYLGILGYSMHVDGRLDGVGGPGIDDSNTLGMHLATGVVAGAMLTLHLRRWRWLLCVISIMFALNAVVLAGSRGAFFGVLAGLVTLAFLRPPAYKKLFTIYACLGVLLIGFVASHQFWERMYTVTAVTSDNRDDLDLSAQSRIAMFNAQLLMAASYPFGSGHRGSEALSPRYLQQQYLTAGGARSSHNSFMTVLVEQGIPGVVLMLAMLAWTAGVLRKSVNARSERDQVERAIQAGAIGGALMVVFVAGMFADFSKCEVQIWMLALLASLTQGKTAVNKISSRSQAILNAPATRIA